MKKLITLIWTIALVIALAACSTGAATSVDNSAAATAVTALDTTSDPATVEVEQVSADPAAATGAAPVETLTVSETLVENGDLHEDASDYLWDSAAAVAITLNGSSISADAAGVTVNGAQATITAAGTYMLSGSLADGQIIVDTQDEGAVRLVLNGVDIHFSTGAPINVINAEKTIILLADNTRNTIVDAAAYVFESADTDEPNAAIFSKSDLTIAGNGALTVTGNFNDGIAAKDGLILAGGAITVNAVDDGVRGKDYLAIKDDVSLSVTAGGDGLKADNEEDAEKGFIWIESGAISISAGGDAIAAETNVAISGGQFNLKSGGGSAAQIDEALSAKGIKGAAEVVIDGGTFAISAADDAIHSNSSLVINNGEFTIASGDDGMHADASLEINGGAIRITESVEGIESAMITINAGDINVVSSDDGINVAGDVPANAENYHLYINGGYIVVDADGDGLDVNGSIEMNAGVVLVNGPEQQMNGALDFDGAFNLNGGFLVAAGSSGMAQAPSETSAQNSLLINFDTMLPAGTLIHIRAADGSAILTFLPTKAYQSIAFSSPEIATGATYDVYYGGSADGESSNGLFGDVVYTPGTQYVSLTITGVVTQHGQGGWRGPGGPRPGGPRP